MRIWHESLIPKLCQKHLCAMWREGLGAYKIITENKTGYRNHPAVKEFENHRNLLWERLMLVRREMLTRGYNPKPLPDFLAIQDIFPPKEYKEWQTLEEQIEVLKSKNCNCKTKRSHN